jgi:hypothetical protein
VADIRPEAARYIGERIVLAKQNNNPDLVDALLDLWIDHQKMADDSDAVAWGINPKLLAAPNDLKRFYKMPHPSLSRLKR